MNNTMTVMGALLTAVMISVWLTQISGNAYGALYTDPNGYYQMRYNESIWDIDYKDVRVDEETGSSEVDMNIINEPSIRFWFKFDLIDDNNILALNNEDIQLLHSSMEESLETIGDIQVEDYGCGPESKYKIGKIETGCSSLTESPGSLLVIEASFEDKYYMRADFDTDNNIQYDKYLNDVSEILNSIKILK